MRDKWTERFYFFTVGVISTIATHWWVVAGVIVLMCAVWYFLMDREPA